MISGDETKRYLAVLGNAGESNAWSGIPYHFYHAGKAVGFFDGALDIHAEQLRGRRLAWNLWQVLRGERFGGFQYSRFCLDRVFGVVERQVTGGEMISHFQLFPPGDLARKHRVSFSFYIDMPLSRLFEEYEIKQSIGQAIAREAVRCEKEGYEQAKFVVCMSAWAARAVREEYGIASEKVKVILPGANIDEAMADRLTARQGEASFEARFSPSQPFCLGYTGKHPDRKGLPRLVAAAEILRSRGYPVVVIVVGHLPAEYRKHPAIRALGYIDKTTQMASFIDSVTRFHLGCLLSYAEGLGISTLECLRLGVPVMGAEVGGIPDCIPRKAGILVPRDATPEVIADAIQVLLDDPTRYQAMRLEARGIRKHYSWKRAVGEFADLWSNNGAEPAAR
jgi:glycosyltransferase involved in cell wall biosynthesis